MHIHNSLDKLHLSTSAADRLKENRSGTNVDKQQVDGSQEAQATDHSNSPEIQRLTQQLREIPDVREDVVQAVAARIAEGEFATREAAEKTAAKIIENSS